MKYTWIEAEQMKRMREREERRWREREKENTPSTLAHTHIHSERDTYRVGIRYAFIQTHATKQQREKIKQKWKKKESAQFIFRLEWNENMKMKWICTAVRHLQASWDTTDKTPSVYHTDTLVKTMNGWKKMNREKFAQSKVVNANKRFALEANDDFQIGIPQRKFSVDSILITIFILHYSISWAIASLKPSNSDQSSERYDLSMNAEYKNRSVEYLFVSNATLQKGIWLASASLHRMISNMNGTRWTSQGALARNFWINASKKKYLLSHGKHRNSNSGGSHCQLLVKLGLTYLNMT